MSAAPGLKSVYRAIDGTLWCVEGIWHHPGHIASINYATPWSGDYVIAQEYGNFNNEIVIVRIEQWEAAEHVLAFEPMKVCEFCGFTRMRPCSTRGICPNLGNMR